MAVLVSVEVLGQTETGYDVMLGMLGATLKQAPGFILHASYPAERGWRVVEVWETEEAADQFFAKHVYPNLPTGIRPKRVFQPLHSLVR